MKVVIAGGSGFLGVSLATFLTAAGIEVVVLSRRAAAASTRGRHEPWDARSLGA